MITANDQDYTVQSTIQGEDIEMSVDEDALIHLMNILTDLYSDPIAAVLREYSANARDAHVEAGNPNPIEVTLPTTLAPFLRIKDQGTGLDADDIRAIYSKYGKTTKDESNDQIGALGLGCKSALTYTNQFTLIGIKDGHLTNVSVSRDEDGLGHMVIVAKSDTDEPNGVEVVIPVKAEHINRFADKAAELYRYWESGTVLVNGEEPAHLEGFQITDDITLIKQRSYEYQNAHLVMGNIAYPIDRYQHDFMIGDGYQIVVRVPIGAVNIPSSREHLRYTKRTKRVLEELHDKLHEQFPKAVERKINDAPDAPTAMKLVLQWSQAIPKVLKNASIQWRGHALPEKLGSADGTKLIVSVGERNEDYYGKVKGVGKHSQEDAIPLHTAASAMWVHGFHRTFTPAVKKKLWVWCDERGLDYPSHFVMTTLKPKHVWISPDQIIAWSPVEAIKLPRVARNKGTGYVGDGRYPAVVSIDGGVSPMDIEPDELADMDIPIYYINTTTYGGTHGSSHLQQLVDDFVLVSLSANRIKKFLRLFPQAQDYFEAMKEFAAIWEETLSSSDRMALSIARSYGLSRKLDTLPVRGLRDPELRQAVYVNRTYNGRAQVLRDQLTMLGSYAKIDVSDIDLFENYPLAANIGYYVEDEIKDHLVLYLNAAYEARNGN